MSPARLVTLLSFAFVSQLALARQSTAPPASPSPQREPEAEAILKATTNAMGGGAAPLDSTASGTVTARVGTQTHNGTIQVLTRGTNQSFEAISLPDMSQTTVYSNWTAAHTSGSGGQEQLTDQLAATSQTALYPLPMLAAAVSNPETSLQYIGQETVDGALASHIRFYNTFASRPYLHALSSFSVRDVWVDSSTALPLKISFTQQVAAGQVFKTLVEFEFSDYQSTNGYLYPHTIKKSLNGTPWLTISIQSVAFNTGLQGGQFQVNCNTN